MDRKIREVELLSDTLEMAGFGLVTWKLNRVDTPKTILWWMLPWCPEILSRCLTVTQIDQNTEYVSHSFSIEVQRA